MPDVTFDGEPVSDLLHSRGHREEERPHQVPHLAAARSARTTAKSTTRSCERCAASGRGCRSPPVSGTRRSIATGRAGATLAQRTTCRLAMSTLRSRRSSTRWRRASRAAAPARARHLRRRRAHNQRRGAQVHRQGPSAGRSDSHVGAIVGGRTMSKIEWTDVTWNPVIGCAKVSAGCKNCYAERMAAHRVARFRAGGVYLVSPPPAPTNAGTSIRLTCGGTAAQCSCRSDSASRSAGGNPAACSSTP